jgi:hypothetical protein
MKLDYLEIGACDFNLLCRNKKKNGLTIEPIHYYYNRIPTEDKLQVAISNCNGYCNMYFLPTSIIEDYNLPNWLRGCNSINHPHPTTIKQLEKAGLPLELILKERIRKLTLKTLIEKKQIDEIDYLKLDCEGHDIYILEEYFKDPPPLFPNKIYFECNTLTDKSRVMTFIDKIPYNITKITSENILLEYEG